VYSSYIYIDRNLHLNLLNLHLIIITLIYVCIYIQHTIIYTPIYLNIEGVKKNDESSFEWWMKAAIEGKEIAQCNLGESYEKGTGCEIDLVQALHWCQKSAAQGFPPAIAAVARITEKLTLDT
jgi:hypothetical protein